MFINFQISCCCLISLDENYYAELTEPISFAISLFFKENNFFYGFLADFLTFFKWFGHTKITLY